MNKRANYAHEHARCVTQQCYGRTPLNSDAIEQCLNTIDTGLQRVRLKDRKREGLEKVPDFSINAAPAERS